MIGESPVFTMSEAKGTIRFSLASTPTHPALEIKDPKGKERIRVAASDEGGPEIRLQDDVEATWMLLSLLTKQGNPAIVLGDGTKDGDADAVWIGQDKGIPRVRLKRGSAMFHAFIGLDGPRTALHDNKGTPSLSQSALEKLSFLALYDNKGMNRASLSTLEDGSPRLTLMDDKDRVLFSNP